MASFFQHLPVNHPELTFFVAPGKSDYKKKRKWLTVLFVPCG